MRCEIGEGKWEKEGDEGAATRGSVDKATLSVRPGARIAMLAVVQMVYPTIKSDARLFREIPCFREIQTRRTSNARAGPARGEEGTSRGRNELRARRPAPFVGGFSVLSLAVSPVHPPVGCTLPSRSSFINPLFSSAALPSDDSPRPFFSFRASPRISRVAEGRNVFVFGLSPDNLRQ